MAASMPYSEPHLWGLTSPQRLKEGNVLPAITVVPAKTPLHVATPTSPASTTAPLSPGSWAPSPLSARMGLEKGKPGRIAAMKLDLGSDREDAQDIKKPNDCGEKDTDKEKSLFRQAEHWHQRCLEAEADCAQAKAAEGRLQLQLAEALERERQLAAKNLELRCSTQATLDAEAELQRLVEKTQCQEQLLHQRDVELLLRGQEARSAEVEFERLREEVGRLSGQEELLRSRDEQLATMQRDLRQALESARGQRAQLQSKDHQLQSTSAELQEARAALRQTAEFRRRWVQQLEELSRQQANSQKFAEMLETEKELFRAQNEHLEQVTMKLRLDLQESIEWSVAAGATPFYHAAAGGELGSEVLRGAEAPPLPRAKRMDYPRRGRPDRTQATSRYDENGHLRSFDAAGRAV